MAPVAPAWSFLRDRSQEPCPYRRGFLLSANRNGGENTRRLKSCRRSGLSALAAAIAVAAVTPDLVALGLIGTALIRVAARPAVLPLFVAPNME